ncbi:NAD(+) diphosphatase [Uliginosibacterium sp. 31-12]|uniref:NAD(+) diphosphatase n=1 Tax=Uliginosibacterium sp. 31-12 TaxID=3062781 RepID=UPI0026E3D7CA|nr:NAD(+) diphosphatase [Uliginosibacterium sp. 31-12]MDO6387876.1 NAD(+) diphosphatase [Uliginosibacterium sp. 31-12]
MNWPADFLPHLSAAPSEISEAFEFAFAGEDLLLSHQHALPASAVLAALPPPESDFLLGQLGGRPCRARRWPAELALPEEVQALNPRAAFGLIADETWMLAARAKHLLGWDRASRFCGACGAPTLIDPAEPAKLCTVCTHRSYPQIAPAVMCLVRKGKELLLARSPHFRPGMYSALAGFVEAGESVEGCLSREVFEETGIYITNIRWFASQPWPFPQSLMLAFHADYAGGEITPQADEIEDAQWFSLDRLPQLPAPVSIAARLLQDGIRQLQSGE